MCIFILLHSWTLKSFALKMSLLTYKQQRKAETLKRVTHTCLNTKWTVKVKIAGWHNKRNMSHRVMEKRSPETIMKHWPIWLSTEIRTVLAPLVINTRGYSITLKGLTNNYIQNSKDLINSLYCLVGSFLSSKTSHIGSDVRLTPGWRLKPTKRWCLENTLNINKYIRFTREQAQDIRLAGLWSTGCQSFKSPSLNNTNLEVKEKEGIQLTGML